MVLKRYYMIYTPFCYIENRWYMEIKNVQRRPRNSDALKVGS